MDEPKNSNTESLKEVTGFWSLSVVNLSYNNLTFFDGKGCTYLRVLNLSHNAISRLSNMRCPALFVLLIRHNKVTDIHPLEGCPNLRYLDASHNRIGELKVVRKMPHLMELRIQENSFDLLEVEYLRSLTYLSHLRITLNPCLEIGMPRLMLVFTLPQVRFLDGIVITPEEIVQAQNAFNPPFSKLAFEDHANRLLDKACQSGNMAFDEFCKMHPVPPILLLVGSFKSNMQQITNYLQDRFRHRVMIGGVHSTATTIESGDQVADIPVSAEGFSEMKNRGEFLAISHILGRACGFATSQISKAAERGAVLVAPVPLETAISLRKWRILPRIVLILPTSRPHFNVDDFIEAEKEKEWPEYGDELEAAEHREHRISFTDRAPGEYPGEHLGEHDYFSHPRHSILKSSQRNQSLLSDLDDEKWSEKLLDTMAGLNDKEASTVTDTKGGFPKTNRKFSTFVKLGEAIDQLDREIRGASVDEGDREKGMNDHPVNPVNVNPELIQEEAASFSVTDKPPGTVASLQLQQTAAGEIKSDPDISDMIAALKAQQLKEQEYYVEGVSPEDWVPDEVFVDEAQYTVIKLYSHGIFELKESHSPSTESEHDYGQISPIMEQPETENKKVSSPSTVPETAAEAEADIGKLPSDEGVIWTETVAQSLSNVKFSEANLAEIATEVLDIEAEDKIRSRKITAYTPSTHFSGSGSNPSIESIPDQGSAIFVNQEVDGDGAILYEPFNQYQGQPESEARAAEPEDQKKGNLGFYGNTAELVQELHRSSEKAESHHTHKFKHRDAMEKAILKTRADYQQFHLDNPGFFTSVYETADTHECGYEIELLVHEMLQDFRKERESKFRLFTSYAGGCGDASDKLYKQDQRAFLQHRMDQFKWSTQEWNLGYHQPSQQQHMRTRRRGSSDGRANFSNSSCPKNLFDPNLPLPRRFNKAKLLQLEKAGELRRQKLLKN